MSMEERIIAKQKIVDAILNNEEIPFKDELTMGDYKEIIVRTKMELHKGAQS